MAETFQILLIDQDKQVADDVRRFLRASAGGAGFSVQYEEDLQRGQSTAMKSPPDAVLLDAALVDNAGAFDSLKHTLEERGVPVLILSKTNGIELRQKAATAGASDYLLKNKLNYFYLPKAIISAIHQHRKNDSGNAGGSHLELLNSINEALLVINPEGDIVYSNIAGRQVIADTEVIAVIRRFISADETHRQFKPVRVQTELYDLRFAPQDWDGTLCVAISINKNHSAASLSLDAKTSMLDQFIQSCSIPFVVLVNGAVRSVNDHFLDIIKVDRALMEGQPLAAFMNYEGLENINLFAPVSPNVVREVMGKKLTTPLELLQKTVAYGENEITICSLATAGQSDNTFMDSHRLMEIASHDLREPVRTSVSYLQLLTEGLKKEGGNKKLLGYVETISAEINRAERMLADMKLLMNMKDKSIKPEKMAMMPIIQETLKQLKSEVDTSDAMVNVSEMPTVKADPSEVKRLVFHLLDNALKFRKADKRPYIEILSRKDGKMWQFCIKDNGIGIDAKYHNVIFEPFRRLNRIDQYIGSGNGLTICRHIVELHGGKLWVESHEGFGSSFFFTLPAE